MLSWGASSPLANERTVYDYDSGNNVIVDLEQLEYYSVPSG